MSKFIKSLGRFKFKSKCHIEEYVEDQSYNTVRDKFRAFLYKHGLTNSSFTINVTEDQSTFWYDLEIVFDNGMIFTDSGLDYYAFNIDINGDCILKPSNLEFIKAANEDEDEVDETQFVINKTISNKSEAKALINELLEYLEA